MFWEVMIGAGVVFAISKAFESAQKADDKQRSEQIGKNKSPRNPDKNSYRSSTYSNLEHIGIEKTKDDEKKHQAGYIQDINFKNAVSSFETSFSSGKLNKYYFHTYKDVYDQFGFKYDFRIKYIDSDGKSTQRDITVNSVEMHNGDGSLNAYCHLRKYQRTFKMDRVSECIDTATGEFVDDIYQYLKEKYNVSSDKSLSDFMEKNSDVLEVLFYVGKADTQLKKEERTIICETVRTITKDDRISDEMVNDIMNEMYPCSERTFKVKIGKMVEYSSDIKQDIFNTMLAIVNTQKTIHPAEQSALDYVSKKWDIPTNQK